MQTYLVKAARVPDGTATTLGVVAGRERLTVDTYRIDFTDGTSVVRRIDQALAVYR